MRNLKNVWRAVLISWIMASSWYWLDAVAQSNDTINRDMEVVVMDTSSKLFDYAAISSEIDRKYNEMINSEQWKEMIQFYWSKSILEQSIRDKLDEMEDHNYARMWESVIRWKINKISEEIISDIKNNPDAYWYFTSDWDFVIDQEKFNTIVWEIIEKEFKDYIKTLPKYKDAYVIDMISMACGLFGIPIIFLISYFIRRKDY